MIIIMLLNIYFLRKNSLKQTSRKLQPSYLLPQQPEVAPTPLLELKVKPVSHKPSDTPLEYTEHQKNLFGSFYPSVKMPS